MNEDITRSLEVLKNGGLILYPTDTIWGIGCDATCAEAVKKVYAVKKREDAKSMLVLMENQALLDRYVDEVPEIAWQLMEVADSPLTIIYPNARNLAPGLLASDGSIGIRITNEPFTKELLKRFRKPIVSTSANISGTTPPTHFAQISEEIKNAVDYVVVYRQNDKSPAKPSSIIKLDTAGRIQIIRE